MDCTQLLKQFDCGINSVVRTSVYSVENCKETSFSRAYKWFASSVSEIKKYRLYHRVLNRACSAEGAEINVLLVVSVVLRWTFATGLM